MDSILRKVIAWVYEFSDLSAAKLRSTIETSCFER
jgi:hypothetical protein